MFRSSFIPGRTLTSRLVVAITAVTTVSVVAVICAIGWASDWTSPKHVSRQTVAAAVLFGFAAVAVASLVAWRLGRELSKPVLVMARTMRRMAEGDLDVVAPRTHSATELGDMARALEAFRANARGLLEAEAGRRAAEKTAQDRSEFLAVMSHEIRTPMNGVLGMAEALAHTPLTAAQREMLAVMTASGGALMSLLNDVLDYAKLESGRITIEPVRFDLAALVRDSAALFRPEAESKGLALVADAAGLPPAFQGDAARIRQVLHNLLSNAVKFTHDGQVTVRVEAASIDETRYEVRVSVTDTGIGIAPDVLPRLFEKFVQGDASTTRAYGGSGLGLAISRELARLMGGDVSVESRHGAGSCFTLVLPLQAAEPVAVATPSSPAVKTEEQGRRLRVLVAEDNPANRKVLGLILEMISAHVVFAFDGAEALDLWAHDEFDLVLMDVQMPNLDGLAATRRLRELEAALGRPRTPVVAVTANAMPHHVAECLAAGMDAHVAKPIRPDELFAAVDQLPLIDEARQAAAA